MTEQQKKASEIDEDRFSRQLAVLGRETMKKMAAANVLIVGLGGLGVEVAKNVLLAGVKSVTLHDDTVCTMADLSAQFYLQAEDVVAKRTRAEASLESLAELNPYVKVSVHSGGALDFTAFSVAVFTDQRSLKNMVETNQECRKGDCKFILAEQHGLHGFVFVDCGSEHMVTDTNGEPAATNLIASIEVGKPTKITVDDSARLNLDDGGGNPDHADRVTFIEVEGDAGMVSLNELPAQKVKVTGPYTLELPEVDSTDFGTHKMSSGYLVQSKPVVKMTFKTLAESLKDPEFMLTDYSKMDTNQLHLLMQAVYTYAEEHEGVLPGPEDVYSLLKVVDRLNRGENKIKVDYHLVLALGRLVRGVLPPLTAALGGVVAQEVLKACSSKFTPVRQWCYLDARELISNDKEAKGFEGLPSDAELAPQGDRYDGLRAAIGNSLVEQLQNSSTFLVGAGAVGCEMIKNMVMLGLACGSEGVLHVTDMDTIETSNLSRQFLYRNSDVGEHKSDTAAKAVQKFNPDVTVQSYQMRVGPETEETFSEKFFDSLAFVANALDNVKARLYMDGRCVDHKKALLESGTLGLKGNTQIVVPFLTESYGSSRDPPEKSIPQCLLHNFPNKVDHTIQWSLDHLKNLFTLMPTQVNAFLDNPKDFIESLKNQPGRLEQLQMVEKALMSGPKSFEDCVAWARMELETYFNHRIQQLLHNFPLDHVTSSGTPFWSGLKRAPSPLSFESEEVADLALDFVCAAARLQAEIFNISVDHQNPDWREQVRSLAMGVKVSEFQPKNGVKIKVKDDEEDESVNPSPVDEDYIFEELSKVMITNFGKMKERMSPIEFEKDDDQNGHMDFITACSNMRASNYKIGLADYLKTKLIAGKIIPAMITTTALVAGLICVEMLKVLTHEKNQRTIEHYRNSFCNLALPFLTSSEPIAPTKTKVRDGWEWSLWDSIEVEGPMTVQELIDHFEKKYQLNLSMMSNGNMMVYSDFMRGDKLKSRLGTELSKIVTEITEQPLPEKNNYLKFEVVTERLEDDEDAEIPSLKYKFK